MNSIKTFKIFPVPVFEYQIENHELINTELEKYIYELKKNDPKGQSKSNAGGWHSPDFIIKDNVVITPEGRNILRGISRDYVMNTLCKQLKIKVIEKNIEPYDVYTADEAFMTGTPFCMLPVTSLNGLIIGNGKVGSIFNSILNKWSKNTGIDVKAQIQNWNKSDISSFNSSPTPYSFNPNKKA